MRKKKELSVKEVGAAFGISAATVGYYTALGLLHVSRRQGTTRYYNARVTTARLKKIQALMTRGYTLRAIKEQLHP